MAVSWKETKHACDHFVSKVLMLALLKAYFPLENVVRQLWWKAWGHDPKADASFHLGKINFDYTFHNRITLSGIIYQFVKFMYGEESLSNSVAWIHLKMFSQRFYQKVELYDEIAALYGNKHPAEAIIAFVKKYDGIKDSAVAYKLKMNPAFAEWYNSALEETLYFTEAEFDEFKAANLAKREVTEAPGAIEALAQRASKAGLSFSLAKIVDDSTWQLKVEHAPSGRGILLHGKVFGLIEDAETFIALYEHDPVTK